MKLNYEGNSLKSGIYKIINTHSNRIYIGQAKRFKERWQSHKSSLGNKKHQNKFLQNDFNSCFLELGNDDFIEFCVVEIMENSTKQERNEREEYWIAQHYDNQTNCYNFKKDAKGSERSVYSYTPEETKKLHSENMKNWWSTVPLETKKRITKKISESQKGTKRTPEQIEKMRMALIGRKVWNKGLKLPQFSGINHPRFGKKNSTETREKISKSLLGNIPWNKGKPGYKVGPASEEKKKKISKANKGKKLTAEHKEKIGKSRKGKYTGKESPNLKMYEGFKLQGPDGTIYTKIECLIDFSNEHDVNYKYLWELIKRKSKKTRSGWQML